MSSKRARAIAQPHGSTAAEVDFGPVEPRAAAPRRFAALPSRLSLTVIATRSRARWPQLLRRVAAGYSLDIFIRKAEKPYTDDG